MKPKQIMILLFDKLEPCVTELEAKMNIIKFSFKDGVVMERFFGRKNGKYLFFKQIKEKFGKGRVKYER